MIEIPWPAPALWPNFRSRSHWPKTRALKVARQYGFYAAKEARVGVVAADLPIRLAITVYPRSSRRQCQPDKDAVTAALKPYFDGIADALNVNDRAFEPQPPVYAEPVTGGRITIEVMG